MLNEPCAKRGGHADVMFLNGTSVTAVENRTGGFIICYISFRLVNFPCCLPDSLSND
jgi:hypothetical protein